jgi:hypothetical protein
MWGKNKMERQYTREVEENIARVADIFDKPNSAVDTLCKYVREDGHFYSVNGTQRENIGEIYQRMQRLVPKGTALPVAALEGMVGDYGLQSTNVGTSAILPTEDQQHMGARRGGSE